MDETQKALMEEDVLEEELMEDSLTHRDPQVKERDEKSPHYVWPRRAEAELVALPMKANSFLVAPHIPRRVPLLMDIMPKPLKLKFKDFDSQ